MLSRIFTILAVLFLCGFTPTDPVCGDGTIYANKKQTQYDSRFDDYPKIGGLPKFKGGEKGLEKLIQKQLKLSSVAKTQMFRLNYQFTVSCEGKISDIKTLGSPKVAEWTNIVEIIKATEGAWSPAKKGGKAIDCVYFNKLSINGSNY